MKRKKRSVRDVLNECWVTPTDQEVDEASREVWQRIEAELKKHDTSLRSLYGDGWSAAPLTQREFQVLTAISLVGARSTVPSLTRIVEDWAGGIKEEHVSVTTAKLEERGLITSKATESAEGGGWGRCGFEMTTDGDRALRRGHAEGKQLENAREAESGLKGRLKSFLKL
jgi:DNA-binding MarR family transcriptional regulator